MTAEEIVVKLIEEDKITSEEAVILIRTILKANKDEDKSDNIPVPYMPADPSFPAPPIAVAYGVQVTPVYACPVYDKIDNSSYTATSVYNPIKDGKL